jgi:hypothetical protein
MDGLDVEMRDVACRHGRVEAVRDVDVDKHDKRRPVPGLDLETATSTTVY